MHIDLPAAVATAIAERARQCGTTPERYVEQIVEQHVRLYRRQPKIMEVSSSPEEKLNRILAIARDCGVSLSDEQLSREHMYD